MAKRTRPVVNAELQRTLVHRFADTVMLAAKLPPARRADIEDAPRFSAVEREIVCVCGVTGSTYTADWDGSEASAVAFAEHAGRETADLVTGSRYYAWLRSSH